jgi:hypothetical protein
VNDRFGLDQRESATIAPPTSDPCKHAAVVSSDLHERRALCARNAPEHDLVESSRSVAIENICKTSIWSWSGNAAALAAQLLQKVVVVRIILESLLALQNLELVPGKASPERDQQIVSLRNKIPERLLAHYDSLMANGRKGVAMIQEGICSECRQPVPAGALNGVTLGHPIQICIHCRCFLYSPVEAASDRPMTARRAASAQNRRASPTHVHPFPSR